MVVVGGRGGGDFVVGGGVRDGVVLVALGDATYANNTHNGNITTMETQLP